MRFYLLPLASAITLALNPLSVLAAEPSSAADANDQNIEKIIQLIKGESSFWINKNQLTIELDSMFILFKLTSKQSSIFKFCFK